MGLTLKEYLTRKLIQRAKEAAINSSRTLQQVAFDLGWQDPYYFYCFFKKHTGQTALKYLSLAKTQNANEIKALGTWKHPIAQQAACGRSHRYHGAEHAEMPCSCCVVSRRTIPTRERARLLDRATGGTCWLPHERLPLRPLPIRGPAQPRFRCEIAFWRTTGPANLQRPVKILLPTPIFLSAGGEP